MIDGHLDEETWSLITPFDDFLQRDPDEGKPASERTELRVAYDDNALYVGVCLFDSAPERIVRRRSRRDGDEDADSVGMYLDSVTTASPASSSRSARQAFNVMRSSSTIGKRTPAGTACGNRP